MRMLRIDLGKGGKPGEGEVWWRVYTVYPERVRVSRVRERRGLIASRSKSELIDYG